MLNSIFGLYNKSEEIESKERLMNFTNLPKEYITYKDVPTVDNEYIHTFIIDDTTVKNKVNYTYINITLKNIINIA